MLVFKEEPGKREACGYVRLSGVHGFIFEKEKKIIMSLFFFFFYLHLI